MSDKLFTARIQTIVCDSVANAKALLGMIQEISFLKRIILVDNPSDEIKNQACIFGIDLLSFSEIEVGKQVYLILNYKFMFER